MRRYIAAAVGSFIFATGFVCSSLADDTAERNELLRKFLLSQDWGTSGGKAVWLMVFNSFRQWEKVAVVLGYADNMGGCIVIKDGLKKAYPEREYICDFVN
jgi:hypothetical protein